ncbi:MAG: response regulator, partial [Myxococcota bacterium]|nr:response regulator [Myxococcota bacterium]
SGIAGVAATSGVLPHLRDRCVLVLEDHPRTRKLLERQLQDLGAARVHSVDSVGDFARGLKTEPSSPPDLVVSDMMLPDGAWPEIVAAINAAGLGSPILFVSGHASREFVKRLPLDNRRAFLAKPFTRPVLRRAIASLLDATAARPEDGPT